MANWAMSKQMFVKIRNEPFSCLYLLPNATRA